MKNNKGFTSWRDESLIITLKWSSSDERDSGLHALLNNFPNAKAEAKGKNKVKITCAHAAQVFFVKQSAENLEAKIV